MDPLDAYMATLTASAPAATTADARRMGEDNGGVWNMRHPRGPRVAPSVDVVARNRRYARLQQLLREQRADASGDNGDDDGYFSDAAMQQRNPALYHLHLGQYLNAASRTQRATPSDQLRLSTFLIDACERKEMEARRVLEQHTWGHYRSVDDHTREPEELEEEEDDEEEEEEDVDGEEVEKSDEDSSAMTIDERRAQLVELMSRRFLDGSDVGYADYAAIDVDEALDDMDVMQRDAEDQYFDTFSDDDDKSGQDTPDFPPSDAS